MVELNHKVERNKRNLEKKKARGQAINRRKDRDYEENDERSKGSGSGNQDGLPGNTWFHFGRWRLERIPV